MTQVTHSCRSMFAVGGLTDVQHNARKQVARWQVCLHLLRPIMKWQDFMLTWDALVRLEKAQLCAVLGGQRRPQWHRRPQGHRRTQRQRRPAVTLMTSRTRL